MKKKSAAQIAWEYVKPLIIDFWYDIHMWIKTAGIIIAVGIPSFVLYKLLEFYIFGGIIEWKL
jgi:hypothetical protein